MSLLLRIRDGPLALVVLHIIFLVHIYRVGSLSRLGNHFQQRDKMHTTRKTTIMVLIKLLTAGILISRAAAHCHVREIVADHVEYQGYQPSTPQQDSTPLVAWTVPDSVDDDYVTDHTGPDIICHYNATPGQTYAAVQAGNSIQMQWTSWPAGDVKTVLTYLASCGGECTTVDKSSLLFTKMDEAALLRDGPRLVQAASEPTGDNCTWTFTIPATITPGNYVLRHEIIVLDDMESAGTAQHYPQ